MVVTILLWHVCSIYFSTIQIGASAPSPRRQRGDTCMNTKYSLNAIKWLLPLYAFAISSINSIKLDEKVGTAQKHPYENPKLSEILHIRLYEILDFFTRHYLYGFLCKVWYELRFGSNKYVVKLAGEQFAHGRVVHKIARVR